MGKICNKLKVISWYDLVIVPYLQILSQVECRTLTNKLNAMEKEFARYKTQSKEEISRNEKTMEDMEGKISEVGVSSK